MKSLRLAACATHPIQYHAPIWRRLAATNGIEFEAFFGTDMSVRGYTDREFGTKVTWDTPLTAGYSHLFLSTDSRIQQVTALKPGAAGLRSQFRRLRPDVVLLTAYGARFHLEAWHAARAVGAKVILRHEASDVALTRSGPKAIARDYFLRWLYARVDGFAVIGTEARRHLCRLGVPEGKMESAYYCVDTDFFGGEVARWMPQRDTLRQELGIGPGDVALVFSGKLILKKDPLLVPAALKLLSAEMRKRMHLLVAGDGILRKAMEDACRPVLGPRLHMLGFLNQTQIGRVYSIGDLLILPSKRGAGETWGLVVNEAMQFGLMPLVSDGVGCGPDMIVPDIGAVFPSNDAGALARTIASFVTITSEQCATNRYKAQAMAKRFDAKVAADGIVSIARRSTGNLCH